MAAQTIHASAVLVGARAVLIRGPAGSGKSRLALALLQAANTGRLRFARLVGDDRIHIEPINGRLLLRPATSLSGLLEVRGLGIRRVAFEPMALAAFVVDLSAADAERLPGAAAQETVLAGVALPRLAVAAGVDAVPLVLCRLQIPDQSGPQGGA